MADGPPRTVLFVPDVFVSALRAERPVWPLKGGEDLAALSRPAGEIAADEPAVPWLLTPLNQELARRPAEDGAEPITAQVVPYDWRHGIAAAAAALDVALKDTDDAGRGRSIVGHGLGALGVLRWMAAAGDGWRARLGDDGRVVLVAPPLHGAEAILGLTLGRGRLFGVLGGLASGRHPSAVLAPFLLMRGVADLLPDRTLELGWWDAAAQDAPYTDDDWPDVLAGRRELRRLAAAAGDHVHVLFGAAGATTRFAVDADGRLQPERVAGGDGWMLNPTDAVPAGSQWHVPVVHQRLVTAHPAAAAVADLLLRGDTATATRTPPRQPPPHDPTPPPHPAPRDLLEAIAGAAAAPIRLRVEVAHGSLDRLKMPVAVGHYAGDELLGAEGFLDGCLHGRLGRRHALGDYPGPTGTALHVSADAHPPGALVVGLGDIGELTARGLSQGVAQALITYALDELDRRFDGAPGPGDVAGRPVELSVASLLIGTRGGHQLSIRQSVVAITRGALLALRALAEQRLGDRVTLDRLVFVELWSDIAIAAGHAVEGLADDPGLGRQPNETVTTEPRLMKLEGRRGNSRAFHGEWSWWRRVIVTEEEKEEDGAEEGGRTVPLGLRFTSLGEKSRAEERLLASHRTLVDDLIRRSTRSIHGVAEGSVSTTLFELLLPNALKETVYDGDDLVLVLDEKTSRYPWELLARRGDDGVEPLVSQISLLRQFKAARFREQVVPALTDDVLVVGTPATGQGIIDLPGAREESEEVRRLLREAEFRVTDSIGGAGHEIVQKLFLHDYRLIHVAAHGLFRTGDPRHSGVVIGGDRDDPLLLTADVFRQIGAVPEVVFLNCCHLGGIASGDDGEDGDGDAGMNNDQRSRLAAGLARTLIGMGVRCVVAAGWAVNDVAGCVFASTFYERLLGGDEYGAAVRAARRRVWRDHGHTTTWGAYQCYGDPTYRLRDRRSGGGGRRRFVALEEVVAEVSDIGASATNVGTSKADREWLRGRLEALVERVRAEEPGWLRDGELCTELAQAWSRVGEPERAIERYSAALTAWDGKAPVRAAEQLANLLDRHGAEPPVPRPRPAAGGGGGERSPTEEWLDWADRLGDTPERASLRGAFLKRRGLAAKSSARYALFESARDAYLRGASLYAPGETHYYPALNAAALAWVTGGDVPADLGFDLDQLLDAARRSARREQAEDGTTLYNALALHDADLLQHLAAGTLDAATARELGREMRRTVLTIGDASQIDSARKQVDFLIECAVGKRSELRDPLRIIRQHL